MNSGGTFPIWENEITYSNVTTSVNGLMSASDKSKLDSIANSANNYSLPQAANGTRGGIELGYSDNVQSQSFYKC